MRWAWRADPAPQRAARGPVAPRGMLAGLRQRLLVMLIAPLVLLAVLNAWFDYRSADTVAAQQDQRLVALLPLLADSVIVGEGASRRAVLLLAPPVVEYLSARPGFSAYAVTDAEGRLLDGEAWLATQAPEGSAPELSSQERGGVTWRIARQRQPTGVGELIVMLGDGSDPRQQWASAILVQVLLPNLVLVAAAAFAVRWAVARALAPLLTLKEALERRSPRDLSPIDEASSPEEVRPLVGALNRLFGLVDDQAESQRRFIADAAHQLRTPLAGLQAQVEAWAQKARRGHGVSGTLELPAAEVERLRGATRRTSQLANQLLALSRADARAMQSQPMAPVALKPLAEAMLEVQLDAASAKRIDLGLDARAAEVLGHEWLLRELMANLVDNAVRYTPEGGTVTIRCGPADAAHAGSWLEVEDDGPGIAAAERGRVRERFYRLPGTLGEGNGLGLAIADDIARLHGATLELADSPAGGLRATVCWPG